MPILDHTGSAILDQNGSAIFGQPISYAIDLPATTHIRIHAENLIDDENAVLTASSEEAEFPVENVAHTFRTRIWRSEGVVDEMIDIDLSGSTRRAASAIVLINHNIPDGVFSIVASNNADMSSPLLDELFSSQDLFVGYGEGGYGEHGWGGYLTAEERDRYSPDLCRVHYFTAGLVEADYWRLRMFDESGLLTEFEIGRILLGPYFEPARNFGYPFRLTPIDESTNTRSAGGQDWTDIKPKRRRLELNFSNIISRTEAFLKFFDYMYVYGLRQDFFVMPYPGGTSLERFFYSMYGKIPASSGLERYAYNRDRITQFVIEESL